MLKGMGRYTTVASRSGQRGFVAQANPGFGGAMGGGNYGMAASAVSPNMDIDVLDGLISYKNPTTVRRIYRDIYYHDVIAGGAVDVQSTLPFSSFVLTGLDDPKMLKAYHGSIENLSLKALMPSLSVDYNVLGAFIGVPNFDHVSKTYKTIMPVNIDLCEMTPAPFFNVDPIIDLKFTKEMQTLLHSPDPRAQRLVNMMPEWMKEGIQQGRVMLDPSNVVYIPRRAFTTSNEGTSYYRRILAIYMLEKALLKGTIGQAWRRQRAIGLLTAGDEEWEPTNEELNSLVGMFMQAEMDPVGAYIATRQGVQYQEVRQGNDFWKYDDIFEFAAGAKMRGLGINEILLTGDANYNTMDAAMSVFIEQISNYRDRVTRELFYDRIFPSIAVANGFYKKPNFYDTTQLEVNSSDDEEVQDYYKFKFNRHEESSGIYKIESKTRDGKTRVRYEAICDGSSVRVPEIDDISKYAMPTIQWTKQLKPKGDQAYLDMLDALSQKGLPVHLRMLAAAAGLNLDDIMDGNEDDLRVREEVKDYMDELQKLMPPPDDGMGGMGGGGFGTSPDDDGSGGDAGGGDAGASGGLTDDDFGTFASFVPNKGVTGSGIRRKGLLSRNAEADPRLQIRGTDGRGKKFDLSRKTKREIETHMNQIVAKMAAEHDQNQQKQANEKHRATTKVKHYHR